MSEFKGTPGPWFVDGFGDVNDTLEITENTTCIAACRGVIDIERDRHNANLIAAAPELLEALKKCTKALDEISWQSWCGPIIDEAELAIDKALGESK